METQWAHPISNAPHWHFTSYKNDRFIGLPSVDDGTKMFLVYGNGRYSVLSWDTEELEREIGGGSIDILVSQTGDYDIELTDIEAWCEIIPPTINKGETDL